MASDNLIRRNAPFLDPLPTDAKNQDPAVVARVRAADAIERTTGVPRAVGYRDFERVAEGTGMPTDPSSAVRLFEEADRELTERQAERTIRITPPTTGGIVPRTQDQGRYANTLTVGNVLSDLGMYMDQGFAMSGMGLTGFVQELGAQIGTDEAKAIQNNSAYVSPLAAYGVGTSAAELEAPLAEFGVGGGPEANFTSPRQATLYRMARLMDEIDLAREARHVRSGPGSLALQVIGELPSMLNPATRLGRGFFISMQDSAENLGKPLTQFTPEEWDNASRKGIIFAQASNLLQGYAIERVLGPGSTQKLKRFLEGTGKISGKTLERLFRRASESPAGRIAGAAAVEGAQEAAEGQLLDLLANTFEDAGNEVFTLENASKRFQEATVGALFGGGIRTVVEAPGVLSGQAEAQRERTKTQEAAEDAKEEQAARFDAEQEQRTNLRPTDLFNADGTVDPKILEYDAQARIIEDDIDRLEADIRAEADAPTGQQVVDNAPEPAQTEAPSGQQVVDNAPEPAQPEVPTGQEAVESGQVDTTTELRTQLERKKQELANIRAAAEARQKALREANPGVQKAVPVGQRVYDRVDALRGATDVEWRQLDRNYTDEEVFQAIYNKTGSTNQALLGVQAKKGDRKAQQAYVQNGTVSAADASEFDLYAQEFFERYKNVGDLTEAKLAAAQDRQGDKEGKNKQSKMIQRMLFDYQKTLIRARDAIQEARSNPEQTAQLIRSIERFVNTMPPVLRGKMLTKGKGPFNERGGIMTRIASASDMRALSREVEGDIEAMITQFDEYLVGAYRDRLEAQIEKPLGRNSAKAARQRMGDIQDYIAVAQRAARGLTLEEILRSGPGNLRTRAPRDGDRSPVFLRAYDEAVANGKTAEDARRIAEAQEQKVEESVIEVYDVFRDLIGPRPAEIVQLDSLGTATPWRVVLPEEVQTDMISQLESEIPGLLEAKNAGMDRAYEFTTQKEAREFRKRINTIMRRPKRPANEEVQRLIRALSDLRMLKQGGTLAVSERKEYNRQRQEALAKTIRDRTLKGKPLPSAQSYNRSQQLRKNNPFTNPEARKYRNFFDPRNAKDYTSVALNLLSDKLYKAQFGLRLKMQQLDGPGSRELEQLIYQRVEVLEVEEQARLRDRQEFLFRKLSPLLGDKDLKNPKKSYQKLKEWMLPQSGKDGAHNIRIYRDTENFPEGQLIGEDGLDGENGLSRLQAISMYNAWRDPSAQREMKALGYTDQTIEQVKEFIGQEGIEIADILKSYYRVLAAQINRKHFEVEGYSLNMNSEYGGPLRRAYWKNSAFSSEEQGMFNASTGNLNLAPTAKTGSMKDRQEGLDIEIVWQDAVQEMFRYMTEANHYVIWADFAKEVIPAFGDPQVKRAIVYTEGERFYDRLMKKGDANMRGDLVEAVDRSQSTSYTGDQWMALRKWTSLGALGLNPVSAIKQYASYMAYVGEDGQNLVQFHADIAEALGSALSKDGNLLKPMMESDYFRNRFLGNVNPSLQEEMNKVNTEVQQALKNTQIDPTSASGMLKGIKDMPFTNQMMILTKMNDSAVVLLSGYPVYKQAYQEAKSKGMNDEAAKEAALQAWQFATERSQQPTTRAGLPTWMRSGSGFFRMYGQYLISPLSYYRNASFALVRSVKTIQEGYIKGTISQEEAKAELKKQAGTMILYYQVLPAMFTAMGAGLNWAFSDDDEGNKRFTESMIQSFMFGPVSGLPVGGSLVNLIGSAGMNRLFESAGMDLELPTYGRIDPMRLLYELTPSPVQSLVQTANGVYSATKNKPPTDPEFVFDIFKSLGDVTPVAPFTERLDAVYDYYWENEGGDMSGFWGRIGLGFSPYAIGIDDR